MIVIPVDEERPVATGNLQPDLEAVSGPDHLAVKMCHASLLVLARIQYNKIT